MKVILWINIALGTIAVCSSLVCCSEKKLTIYIPPEVRSYFNIDNGEKKLDVKSLDLGAGFTAVASPGPGQGDFTMVVFRGGKSIALITAASNQTAVRVFDNQRLVLQSESKWPSDNRQSVVRFVQTDDGSSETIIYDYAGDVAHRLKK